MTKLFEVTVNGEYAGMYSAATAQETCKMSIDDDSVQKSRMELDACPSDYTAREVTQKH